MQRRAPYIHLPQELVHALTLYGRLSGTEWAVLMTVAHYTFGWNRTEYPIGMATFQTRMPGIGVETIRRSIRHLSTPAGSVYQRVPGHGILVVGARGERDFSTSTTWAIQTDWRRWGWPDGSDLTAVGAVLCEYHVETQPETWSAEAAEVAAMLRTIAVGPSGSGVLVPDISQTSNVWRRWCLSVQEILDRNVHPATMEAALSFVGSNSFWSTRVVGMNADTVMKRNWDQIYAQWREFRNTTRRGL